MAHSLLDSWSSPVHADVIALDEATGGHSLALLGELIFARHQLLGTLVRPPTLRTFLARMEAEYGNNRYHCSIHGADVMLSVHLFLSKFGLLRRLTPVQLLAALVGAVVHDFRHPGTTNAHEVKAHTHRATTHSDSSVLERHHLASAFEVLEEPGHRLLEKLAPEAYQECRSLIIELVLHTDLSKHFEFVARLNSLASSKGYRAATGHATAAADDGHGGLRPSPRVAWRSPYEEDADVRLVLVSAIKFADLGHVTKPFASHRQWVERVTEELYALGDHERRLGVPISGLCDRERDVDVAKSQIGFMQFVCMPFLKVLADLVCGPAMEPYVNAQENFWQWHAAHNEDKQSKEEERSRSSNASERRSLDAEDLDSVSSTLAPPRAAGQAGRYASQMGRRTPRGASASEEARPQDARPTRGTSFVW